MDPDAAAHPHTFERVTGLRIGDGTDECPEVVDLWFGPLELELELVEHVTAGPDQQ